MKTLDGLPEGPGFPSGPGCSTRTIAWYREQWLKAETRVKELEAKLANEGDNP